MGADNAYTPARAGFVGDPYTLANETADGTKDRDLVHLKIVAPVRSISDNPKTINQHTLYTKVVKLSASYI